MIVIGNAIEAELYFDEQREFVINIPTPEVAVFPNGNVGYINRAGEPFIVGKTQEEIDVELDEFVKFLEDRSNTLNLAQYSRSMTGYANGQA